MDLLTNDLESLGKTLCKSFILFLLVVSNGCANQKERKIPEEIQAVKNLTVYSANEVPEVSISFKKEAVYGDSGEILIGRIGDIAVDRLGRVFIADVKRQKIHVFKAKGQFIKQLGREGRGPEEFSYIKKLKIHDDILYVADANFGIREISLFSLKNLTGARTMSIGENSKNYTLPTKAYPGIHDIFVRDDGSYLAEYVAHNGIPSEKKWQKVIQKGFIYLLDNKGELASEQLFEFKEAVLVNKPLGLVGPIEPFFGTALKAMSKNGALFWADPKDFLIKEYSSEGIYRKSFYYPIKKVPLTKEAAVKAGVHEYYIQGMKKMEAPSFWPVLKEMKIDDQDRFWIATTIDDLTQYEWWVLESSGELITKFRWPRVESIEFIIGDYFYTLNSNTEQVVQYQYEFKQ